MQKKIFSKILISILTIAAIFPSMTVFAGNSGSGSGEGGGYVGNCSSATNPNASCLTGTGIYAYMVYYNPNESGYKTDGIDVTDRIPGSKVLVFANSDFWGNEIKWESTGTDSKYKFKKTVYRPGACTTEDTLENLEATITFPQTSISTLFNDFVNTNDIKVITNSGIDIPKATANYGDSGVVPVETANNSILKKYVANKNYTQDWSFGVKNTDSERSRYYYIVFEPFYRSLKGPTWDKMKDAGIRGYTSKCEHFSESKPYCKGTKIIPSTSSCASKGWKLIKTFSDGRKECCTGYTTNSVCDCYGVISQRRGLKAKGISTLVSARNSKSKNTVFLRYMYDSHHEISEFRGGWKNLDQCGSRDPNTGNCVEEWYIGPSLDEAIAGVNSKKGNPLTLVDYRTYSKGNYSSTNTKDSIGILVYWLWDKVITPSCTQVCTNKNGTKLVGDTLLECAEHYCDTKIKYDDESGTQGNKQKCILEECEYNLHGGDDGSPFEQYNCSNKSPYNNVKNVNVNTVDNPSSCGGDNYDSNGNKINTTGVQTYCEENTIYYNTTTKDGKKIIQTSPLINFDERRYYNVACKEISTFNFSDLSKKKIVAGEYLEYYVKLKAQRECTIFFDVNTWKLDYASVHSKDLITDKEIDGGKYYNKSTRQRLLDILAEYNDLLEKTNNNSNKKFNFFKDIDFNKYNFDLSKVSISSYVNEVILNKNTKSDKYDLEKVADNSSSNFSVTTENKTFKFDKYKLYTNSEKLLVNRYIKSSTGDATYMYPKFCVTNDGTGNVYLADDNGVCYKSKNQNIGSSGTVYGRNNYYTNLQATSNSKFNSKDLSHYVSTEASVRITSDINSGTYVKLGDSCPYEIDEGALSCTIYVVEVGDTKLLGDDIYEGNFSNTIKAYMKTHNNLVITENGVKKIDETKEQTLSSAYGKLTTTIGGKGNPTLEISLKNETDALNKININGKATTKSGKSVTCNKVVYVLVKDNKCPVKCDIDMLDSRKTANGLYDNVYEIKSTGTQFPNKFSLSLSTNPENFQTVLKSKYNNRDAYISRITLTNKNNFVIGKVDGTYTNTNTKCDNYCYYKEQEQPNCTKENKPAETDNIRSYCEENWMNDINNYKSVDDCKTRCELNKCPLYSTYDELVSQCNYSYQNYGYKTSANCVNTCYCENNYCGTDYVYRPILLKNPFPNSYEDIVKGERLIGANWVGKSKYITDDCDDPTKVTCNTNTESPEYEIVLTPARIRQIRNQTASYNSNSKDKNAYLDYVFATNSDKYADYKSKFIRDSNTSLGGFKEYFTYIDGTYKGQ